MLYVMAKFAFITGYISVLCKVIGFLVAFWTGLLLYEYENKYRKKQYGTLWICLILSCVMVISTLLCDILMTLILISYKLDRQKVEMNRNEVDNMGKNISIFTFPFATHFENRVSVNKTTRQLSLKYLLTLTLWLVISFFFVVGNWINFVRSSIYMEEKILEEFLCTFVVVTVIFTLFLFLPLGIFLVIGLN